MPRIITIHISSHHAWQGAEAEIPAWLWGKWCAQKRQAAGDPVGQDKEGAAS